MALFWVLEDMLYSIPWSIKYLDGSYPYPEFVGHWREAMFGSFHPLLGKVGAFFEQVWFWDLPAFFYIGLGSSALVYSSYYLWLWAGGYEAGKKDRQMTKSVIKAPGGVIF